MSDDYFYTGYDQYYAEEKSKTAKKTRILKILMGILISVLVVEALLYTVVFPCLKPVEYSFVGLKNLSADSLLRNVNAWDQTSWMKFDTASFSARLAGNSAIESISVEKKFPNIILVNVEEREAVAYSLVNTGGRTQPILIDRRGNIFSVENFAVNESVPLISGLDIERFNDSYKLSTDIHELLDRIRFLRKDYPRFLEALSEIHVVPTEFGSYELILYPIHSHIPVLSDRNLSEKTMDVFVLMVAVFNETNSDVTEIDTRYGSVSYRFGGAAL